MLWDLLQKILHERKERGNLKAFFRRPKVFLITTKPIDIILFKNTYKTYKNPQKPIQPYTNLQIKPIYKPSTSTYPSSSRLSVQLQLLLETIFLLLREPVLFSCCLFCFFFFLLGKKTDLGKTFAWLFLLCFRKKNMFIFPKSRTTPLY